ncbi:MAG: hypothetical protein V1866_00345 [archaeon]
MNKKPLVIAIILLSALLITACDWSLLAEFLGASCDDTPDSAHCHQGTGVQSGNTAECDKIKAPAEYAKVGSNPPKDKCYLMIAQNTGDYSICKKIAGGYASYTQEECFTDIAVEKEDPAGCRMMTGAAFDACKSKVAPTITADKLTSINEQIDGLKSAAGKGDEDAAKQLADLEKKKKDMLSFMTPAAQADYLKKNREEIMGDIDDEDVKSEIAQDFMKARAANPTLNIDQLVQKLKDIKEQKETVKRLDEAANTLMDQMKSQMQDYTDEKKQEMIDAATEKGWGWMKENGGDNLKWGLSNLESMKAKYDKASEAYDKLDKQIKKIKGVYDEVMGVYKKVDEFNKMVAEGKIDKGQAKVLKGAVLLGKGLEYATQYVPVFGSTVSTISKETFGVVVKVATQRAQRTNSMQKCLDDPENCDPNGISAY